MASVATVPVNLNLSFSETQQKHGTHDQKHPSPTLSSLSPNQKHQSLSRGLCVGASAHSSCVVQVDALRLQRHRVEGVRRRVQGLQGGNGLGERRRRVQWRAEATDDKRSSGGTTAVPDQMMKFMSQDSEVSVTTLIGTQLVQEAQKRHSLAPTAAAALGRLLMGTLLLGASRGPDEVVQVSINGRGPIGLCTAIATHSGQVKGYVGDPSCDPPLNSRNKMDVGAAVGPGVITVVRSHPSWQQPYTGTVPIQTGEIAEDLAHYLAESEQVNSALGLGVAVGRDGRVIAAGGFLVQVLPLCSEEKLLILEQNVTAMPAVSDLVKSGEDATALVGRLLNSLTWSQAGETVMPSYGPCGPDILRPRMLKAIKALGPDDVNALLLEHGEIEVKCEFCAESLKFSAQEVEPLITAS